MGGRGTYSLGQLPVDTYETIDYIEDVKVLEKIDKLSSKSLPEDAHTSKAYILLDENGNFRMYREYDANHRLKLEIGYHIEPNVNPSHKPVLHAHDYTNTAYTFVHGPARPLTLDEWTRYKKYFKGVI